MISKIIKGGAVSDVARRLVSEPVLPVEQAKPVDVKMQLRETFADELMLLRQEVVAEAKTEINKRIEAEIDVARAKAEKSAEERYALKQKALESTIAQLSELAVELKAQRGLAIKELEASALEIAVTALVKLLSDSRRYTEMMANIIQGVTREFEETRSLRVLLNPQDYQQINKLLSGEFWSGVLHSDASLAVGSCVVSSPVMHIDASLNAQVERLNQALLDVYRKA